MTIREQLDNAKINDNITVLEKLNSQCQEHNIKLKDYLTFELINRLGEIKDLIEYYGDDYLNNR